MSDVFLNKFTDLERRIKNTQSININSRALKDSVIELGKYYFQQWRPTLQNYDIDEADLLEIDSKWQNLIRLAHANGAKSTYLKIMRELRNITTELNISVLSGKFIQKTGANTYNLSESELKIIKTLNSFLVSAADSYKQGILDLRCKDMRFSYRGTAVELREALRETLNKLAPDEEIIKNSDFKLEKDKTRPSMKQKVRFILRSRGMSKTQRTITEKSVEYSEGLFGDITRAFYDRASVSTHLKTKKEEVSKLKNYLDPILNELLEIN